MPKIRLPKSDGKSGTGGPLFFHLLLTSAGNESGIGQDMSKFFQRPCLADGESTIGILAGLVHSHFARSSHRDEDDSVLLVPVRRVRWRRRGGIRGIFKDFDMGYIGLKLHAIRIPLVEAAFNDTSLLIFKTRGAGLVGFRLVGRLCTGHTERAIAVAVGQGWGLPIAGIERLLIHLG